MWKSITESESVEHPVIMFISESGLMQFVVAFVEKYKLGKVVGKRKINYGSYYVVEFNLARLAQLDPEGTERYLLENGLDQKEFKADQGKEVHLKTRQ